MQAVRLSLLLLLLAGCEEIADAPDPCVIGGAPWEPGEPAFENATERWGLSSPEVIEALRVSVTDHDGDRYPDLLVRYGGGPDEFGDEPVRRRRLLRNDGQTLVDVTEQSGLLTGRDGVNGSLRGEVVASADVDNDGDVDILFATTVNDPTVPDVPTSEVALNNGDGTYTLSPLDSDLRDAYATVPVGAAFSDVDRDGSVDVFISNNMRGGDSQALQDRLHLGLGDGTFVDGTLALGLETSRWNSIDTLNEAGGHSWGWGSLACDLNNDGLPELLSASYGRMPNHLFVAREGGELGVDYRNRSVASGYAYDHREEWWLDLSAQCWCADHPSDEDCDLAPEPDPGLCQSLRASFGDNYRWNHGSGREPYRLGGNSATSTCVDVDNDGWFDLLTGEIVHWDVGWPSDPAELMVNTRDGAVVFDRPGSEALGLDRDNPERGWDNGDMNNAVLDFDNDGRMDLYVSSSDYPGTRGWLWHQRGPLEFEAVPTVDGVDHRRSAGVAAVDLDRDGDQDLVVGTSQMRCNIGDDCYDRPYLQVWENVVGDRNNHLQLRLTGTGGSNAMAVGARVEVQACGETLTRQVDGGHGHQGLQDDRVLHFGLGGLSSVVARIFWPDAAGTVEELELEAGAYDVVQGEGASPW